MGVKVSIGGVDKTSYVSTRSPVVYGESMSERPTASFECVDGYIPDRMSEVVIYEPDETTPAWGGIVLERRVRRAVGSATKSACFVTCGGFISYADYAYVSLSYDEDVALEDVIDDVVTAKLGAYGVTYTPVATGVTLAAFSCTHKRVSDLFREFGVAIRVAPDKELTVYAPGDSEADFEISDSDRNAIDIEWSDDGDIPPNKITMICGAGKHAVTEEFTSDGTQTEYVTSYPASQTNADPFPNTVIVNGTVVAVAGWGPDQLPAGSWYWDFEAHKLVNGTGSPLTAGAVVTVPYTRQDPFEESDDTGASPVIEEVIVRTDVGSRAQAQEQIALRLAQVTSNAKVYQITTRTAGCVAGQLLPVAIAQRGGIADDIIAQEVVVTAKWDTFREHVIHASSAASIRRSYLAGWREMSGAGGGGTAAAIAAVSGGGGGGGGGTVVAAGPVDLGGWDGASFAASDWTRIVNAKPFVAQATYTGRVRCEVWARDSGVGATVRLRNVTDGSGHVESSEVTTQTRHTETSFVVAIAAGKRYLMEAKVTTGSGGIYVSAAQLEAA